MNLPAWPIGSRHDPPLAALAVGALGLVTLCLGAHDARAQHLTGSYASPGLDIIARFAPCDTAQGMARAHDPRHAPLD